MNARFAIERGVPIPRKSVGEGLTAIMNKMEVGDSFVVPEEIRASPFMIAARIGIRITTRLEKDGVRVWRIE